MSNPLKKIGEAVSAVVGAGKKLLKKKWFRAALVIGAIAWSAGAFSGAAGTAGSTAAAGGTTAATGVGTVGGSLTATTATTGAQLGGTVFANSAATAATSTGVAGLTSAELAAAASAAAPVATTAATVGTTAAAAAGLSPLAQAAMITVGGGVVSGYMGAKAQEKAEKDRRAEEERLRNMQTSYGIRYDAKDGTTGVDTGAMLRDMNQNYYERSGILSGAANQPAPQPAAPQPNQPASVTYDPVTRKWVQA